MLRLAVLVIGLESQQPRFSPILFISNKIYHLEGTAGLSYTNISGHFYQSTRHGATLCAGRTIMKSGHIRKCLMALRIHFDMDAFVIPPPLNYPFLLYSA